jgi:transposase-like protein
MGVTNMSKLKQVKSRIRYTASHRRAVVRRALKLLDVAEEKSLSYAEIARRTGLPASTLRDWRKRRQEHPGWTPTNTMWGQHLRILSPCEEKELAEFVHLEVQIPGHIFQDADFRAYAIAAGLEKDGHRNHVKPFNCSAGDISNFKKRHHFSSRNFHDKRRPSVTTDQQEQWMNRIEELLRPVPHDRVLNTDETSWLLWPRGILT